MSRISTLGWLLCCCLVLALSGCGNKGPLVLPDDDKAKKSRSEST
ncbi:MAG: lipoprotein [Gammaproteobacteria bacterium]|nr:lipoprotein [Gammaproteobacteria bacterium]MDH3534418.1 lipoprotein [Gammaproteobacteria bacterium]